MKDYHWECIIIILTHLAAEVGDLINTIQDRESFVEDRFNTIINDKFNNLSDILSEAGAIWEDN